MIAISITNLYGIKFSHKEKIIINNSDPSIQSQAAFILLKKQYEMQSAERKALKTKSNWRVWLTFRNRYLRRIKKKEKDLVCAYCGLKNLHMNANSPNALGRIATIDHVVPTSKGGKKFDESNFVVACFQCNNKKADKMPENFIRSDMVQSN